MAEQYLPFIEQCVKDTAEASEKLEKFLKKGPCQTILLDSTALIFESTERGKGPKTRTEKILFHELKLSADNEGGTTQVVRISLIRRALGSRRDAMEAIESALRAIKPGQTLTISNVPFNPTLIIPLCPSPNGE